MQDKLKDLTFEEIDHIYKYQNKRIPSVTQIISPISKVVYENINIQTLTAKSRLGSKVHKQIERKLKFDYANPDDTIEDYFNNYLAFENDLRANNNVENLHNEFKGIYASHEMTFAGTIDNIRKVNDELWLIDWKTVANPIDLLLSLQMYGYKLIAESLLNIKVDKVLAVIFSKNNYKVHDVTSNVFSEKISVLFKNLYDFYMILDNEGILKLKNKFNEENF